MGVGCGEWEEGVCENVGAVDRAVGGGWEGGRVSGVRAHVFGWVAKASLSDMWAGRVWGSHYGMFERGSFGC